MNEFLRDCFSTHGRWNRKRFFLYPIGFTFLVFGAFGITLYILFNFVSQSIGEMFAYLTFPLVLLVGYVKILSTIKRFRDLGHTGWFTVFTFIPVVNIVFMIYLFFFKGQEGENEFGADPLISEENQTYDGVILK